MDNVNQLDGSADLSTKPSGLADEIKEDKVSYESHQKMLKQLKATQAKLNEVQALEEKLKAYEAEKADLEEKKLMERGEFQKLNEELKKQLRVRDEQLSIVEKQTLRTVKLQAFQRHLGGRIADESYYSFVDTDKIAIDPVTKDVDEETVKSYVNEFVGKHKRLVDFGTTTLPNSAATPSKSLTYEEWLKLPRAEQRVREKEVMKQNK